MKSYSNGLFIVVILCLFVPVNAIAQGDEDVFEDLINYSAKDSILSITSNATLNALFNKHLNSLLSNSGHISTNKGQVFYSPDDKNLHIGMTKSNVNDFNKKLRLIAQGSLYGPINKKFAEISNNENELTSGMGASIKLTWIGNGYLNMGKKAKSITKLKSGFKSEDSDLTKELRAKRKLIALELQNELRRDIAHLKKMKFNDKIEEDKYLKEKIQALKKTSRNKFVEKELEVFESSTNVIYNSFCTWWSSLEVDFGFTDVEQPFVMSLMDPVSEIDTVDYRPYRIEGSLGGLYSNRCISEAYGRIGVGLEKMNIIKAKSISPSTISVFSNQISSLDSISQASVENKAVYKDDSKSFLSRFISLEATMFPRGLKGAGLRLAYKKLSFKHLGKKDYVEDWTVAVPFKFNDKDGKPNVKFELQWRKRNGAKSFGVSAGIPFGGSIFQ